MVDTGATPNLIKIRNLHPETQVRKDDTVSLRGITKGTIQTLGSAKLSYGGHPFNVHAVSNNFPIPQEGILGSEFLQTANKIDFKDQAIHWKNIRIPFSQRETVVIPARSRSTFYIRIKNPELTVGYVPRLSVCSNVYLGEAIVTNREGKAYLQVVNASDIDRELIVPVIELQEIEQISRGSEPDATLGSSKQILSVSSVTELASVERSTIIQNLLRLDHLNKEETEHVINLIKTHDDLFQLPNDKLGHTGLLSHKITTANDQPIHTKQYRFPPIHKEEIEKQIKELLDNDIIKHSESPYNSPLWIVPKKPDSKGNKRWRMVIDYRSLNEKTIGDAYPLPNITEILDQLGSAKYFSVFDLASGFHQIPMHESHAQKTAFSTPHGHYEFKRMPFGLKNAPATFQRLMDQVLCGLQGTELFVYLDDIVLYASSLREHQIKFEKLAERLRRANLKLQPDKCEFLRHEVGYLGHIISDAGVKPDPNKIIAVKNFPRPKQAKNIKQFLGLAGYYRRFINNFSKLAQPLTKLLKKEEPFVWKEEQELAFTQLRNALCNEPILRYPDFTQPFIVTTDASGYAIGGILSQGTVGKDLPIAYASRLLNKAERNYSTIEKELLAIVYSVNHFRPYLYGRQFLLVTDHKPLVWLHSIKDPSSRLVRWRLKLLEYEYKVEYKAGKINANADALSRNPIEEQILPLENVSDSEESLFSTNLRKKTQTQVSCDPQVPTNSSAIDDVDNSIEDESDQGSEIDNSTSSSEMSEIFNNPRIPFELQKSNTNFKMVNIPDNFITRRDNLVIFTTQQGVPLGQGAKMLHENNKLPTIKDATLGRAKVNRESNRHLISLIVKERISVATEIEIIKEVFRSLKDVVIELDLRSISICRENVDSVNWNIMYSLLQRILSDTNLKIFVCMNKIEIPPPADREAIIADNHNTAIGGHKGVTKTYNRLKERYSWPKMKEDVQNFIHKCKDCQLKKLVRIKTKQPMVLTDTPGTAFDKISMDIMGPLPTTALGNTYILTIQDLLTKYSLAIPLKHASAIDIADAFTNEFICIYGAPVAWLTDQGSHFLNSLMRNIANKFKIKQYKTTAYRPQSNGSIERSHHVLWEYLKQYVNRNREWDQFLKLAAFSYNTSIHEGTRYTPHELVFGKIARVPSNDPPLENEENETYSRYLRNLFSRIRDVQDNARENLIKAKTRSKRYYDKRLNVKEFKLGEYVYLLKEPNKGKLSDQYTGPYEIIQILGNNNVKLAINNVKTRVVHKNKLKPAFHHSTGHPHSSMDQPYSSTSHPHSRAKYKGNNRTEDRSLPNQP